MKKVLCAVAMLALACHGSQASGELTRKHKMVLAAAGLAGLGALAYYTSGSAVPLDNTLTHVVAVDKTDVDTMSMEFKFLDGEKDVVLDVQSGPDDFLGQWRRTGVTICDSGGTNLYQWIDGTAKETKLDEGQKCDVKKLMREYYNPLKGTLKETLIRHVDNKSIGTWQYTDLAGTQTRWDATKKWFAQCGPQGTTVFESYDGPAREVKEDKTCIEPQFSYAAILKKAHPEGGRDERPLHRRPGAVGDQKIDRKWLFC